MVRDGLSSRGAATRLVIHGAGGRVGARLCALAHADSAFELVGAMEREGFVLAGQPVPGTPDNLRFLTSADDAPACDVVIDFSSDEGARRALSIAERCSAALLVGTTALSDRTAEALARAGDRRAVLVAANTSLGVAVLASVVREAARSLGPAFSGSIVEAHHGAKKDAPSGTAKRLAEAARSAGANAASIPHDQIVSIRGGDVVGEHTVRFAGPGEYVELTHRATTRDVFVLGALRAARWLHGRAPGRWTMEDVLGLAKA